MAFHRTTFQIAAAVLGAFATLAVAPNASACPAGGCLSSPPACPNNTNCITVTDPNYWDMGNSGYCTLNDAVDSFTQGSLVDGCQWTGGSSAFAVLLPGVQNGHAGVQYPEPEGFSVDSSYNQRGIEILGSSAANSTIVVGNVLFQNAIEIQGGSSLVNITVTAFVGTTAQGFYPGNCVYIDGKATLTGVTMKNCFPYPNNPYGVQGLPALLVGPPANATITNCTITNNSGGGIEVNTQGDEDVITSLSIIGSVISYNTKQSEGAGIAVHGGDISLIQDSLIEYNKTTVGAGGGISVDADPQNQYITASIDVIKQSAIVYNSAPSGGGVALLNGNIESAQVTGIIWSTIAYNQATNGVGGGVYFLSGSSNTNQLYARHDTVADNTATSSGGGVWAQSGQVDWQGSIFAYNTVSGRADDFDGQLRIMGSGGLAAECWTDGLDANQIRTLSNPPPTGWQASSCPPSIKVKDQNASPSFSSNSLSWSTGAWQSGTPSLPYFAMKANPPGGQTQFYQKDPNEKDELDHVAAHTGSSGYYVIGSIETK